ncbi:hypothetical protein FisN_27Hh078 [Fistulifera solaris]|jgi:hypothetical protein|uniref:Uncharacterized protein n=1 Tax=Fistulifera solaris TaxID=1519565 RepID=A0A1Z5KQI5_FISSO|nr:hypothetical protein FisN_27Hh078 [Fistulifera solaris]|eukprot:GAX28271.1 hypothetical protein FisN_27Hh078 [Fistulifera solaris]
MAPSQQQHRRPFNPFIARSRHTTASLTYRDTRYSSHKRGGGSRLVKVAFGGLCFCISYWLLGVGIWQTAQDDRLIEELSDSVLPTQRRDNDSISENNERHYSFLRQLKQPTPAPTLKLPPTPAPTKQLMLTPAPTKQLTLTLATTKQFTLTSEPTLPPFAKEETTGDRHLPPTIPPNKERRGGDVHTESPESEKDHSALQYLTNNSIMDDTTVRKEAMEMGELRDDSNSTIAIHSTTTAARNEITNKDTPAESPDNTIVETSFVEKNETSDTKQEFSPSIAIGEDVSENKENNNIKETEGVDVDEAQGLAVEEFNRTIIKVNTANITLHGNQSITEATTTESDAVILEQSNRHELYKVSDDVTNSKSNVITVKNNNSVIDTIILDDSTKQAKEENDFDDADRMDELKKGDLIENENKNVTKQDESVTINELVEIDANKTWKRDNLNNDQVLVSFSQNSLTNGTTTIERDNSTSHPELHQNSTTTVNNAILVENATSDTTSDS